MLHLNARKQRKNTAKKNADNALKVMKNDCRRNKANR
jgi:hypothetical protein